jgi:hypothetical protein
MEPVNNGQRQEVINLTMQEVQQWLGEKEMALRMAQRTMQQILEENNRLKEEIKKLQNK